MSTNLCKVLPNVYGSSVWYLHHVTLLTPGIFRWLLDFWIICAIRVKTNGVSSNKSPTRCKHFPVYYPDVYLQLNMLRAFSRPSSGAQWLQ